MFKKVASLLGIILILVGITGFIVSLVTNQWGTISLTIDGSKIGDLAGKSVDPKVKKASGYIDMHFGLKQLCTGHAKIDPELLSLPQFQQMNIRQSFPVHACRDIDMFDQIEDSMSDEDKQNPAWKLYKKVSSALRNTMICIGAATGLAIVGLIISFVKLPVWYTGKGNVLAYITMAVCGLAVVSSVAGIVLFHQDVKIKNEIKDLYGTTIPKFFEIGEKWGYSHHLACVGIGCLFLAVFMNIFEVAFGQNNPNDGYEMSLVRNAVYA